MKYLYVTADSESVHGNQQSQDRNHSGLSGVRVSGRLDYNRAKHHRHPVGSGRTSSRRTTVSMRRALSQDTSLDVITFETFKPRLTQKKQQFFSCTWGVTERKTNNEPLKCVDDEEERVYDTVVPFAQVKQREKANNPGYNKLVHPAYPTGGNISPTHQHLAHSESIYASLNEIDEDTVYDMPMKTVSLFSIADMDEDRENTGHETQNPRLSLEGYYDFPRPTHGVVSTTTTAKPDSLYAHPADKP